MKKISYRLIYNRKGKLNKEGKALIQTEAYLYRQRHTSQGIRTIFQRIFMCFLINGIIRNESSYVTRKPNC